MTSQLPALKAREVIRALERAGFVIVRTKGSHRMLKHSGDPSRKISVPDHGNKDLKKGTLRGILRQAGLTIDEFVKLL